MLSRSTRIILVIFLVLVIGLVIWRNFTKTNEEIEPTATPEVKQLVFQLSDHPMIGYSILSSDGKSIMLELSSNDDQWTVIGYPTDQVDTTQIKNIANTMIYLSVATSLATEPPLAAMGLDQPSYTVTIAQADGIPIVLYIGDLTPVGDGYYVMVEGNQAVVVGKSDVDTIINLLNNPPMLPTSTPEPTISVEPEANVTPETNSTPIP